MNFKKFCKFGALALVSTLVIACNSGSGNGGASTGKYITVGKSG